MAFVSAKCIHAVRFYYRCVPYGYYDRCLPKQLYTRLSNAMHVPVSVTLRYREMRCSIIFSSALSFLIGFLLNLDHLSPR